MSLQPIPEGEKLTEQSDRWNHHAVVRISAELLAEILKLPPGTRILDISRDVFFGHGQIGIRVENPEFRAVREGQALPEITPLYAMETKCVFHGWQK